MSRSHFKFRLRDIYGAYGAIATLKSERSLKAHPNINIDSVLDRVKGDDKEICEKLIKILKKLSIEDLISCEL